jgi:hypothetical protein
MASTINILLLSGTEKNHVYLSKYSFPAESWKANVLDLILDCIVYRPCIIGASEVVCFRQCIVSASEVVCFRPCIVSASEVVCFQTVHCRRK